MALPSASPPFKQSDDAKYFESVQIIRGLAALLVLVAHASTYRPDLQIPPLLRSLGSLPEEGVTAFFVISGFALPWSLLAARYDVTLFPRFMAKRLIRLEPVYLVSLLVAASVFYIQSRLPQFPGAAWDPTLRQMGLHLLYLVPFFGETWLNPVFWTLGVEFQFYLFLGFLFPLLARLVRRMGPTAGVIVPVVLAIPSAFPHDYHNIMRSSALFATGICVFLWHAKMIGGVSAILGTAASVALFFAQNGTSLCLAALVTAALIGLWDPGRTWLSRFGSLSYSLYVFHLPVVWIVIRGGMVFFKTPAAHCFLWAASIAVSILIAALAYQYVERPSQLLSKRIRYSRNKGVAKAAVIGV